MHNQLKTLTGKRFAVLGCGWLGLPLAKRLLTEGAIVHGSTTSQPKLDIFTKAGIKPFLLSLPFDDLQPAWHQFLEVDYLVVNIPANEANITASFLESLGQVLTLAKAAGIKQLVAISSTGIYAAGSGTVTENNVTGNTDKALKLLALENCFSEFGSESTTILRAGGLFGPNRNPGRFLAGKTTSNAQSPVNFIHLTDLVNCIVHVFTSTKNTGGIYNAVCTVHPTRKNFYTRAASLLNILPPVFTAEQEQNPTLVLNTKLTEELGFKFNFSNPIDALLHCE